MYFPEPAKSCKCTGTDHSSIRVAKSGCPNTATTPVGNFAERYTVNPPISPTAPEATISCDKSPFLMKLSLSFKIDL